MSTPAVISRPTWYVYFVDGHREKVEGPTYEAQARLRAQEQRIARGETGHTIQRVTRLRGVPLVTEDPRQKQNITIHDGDDKAPDTPPDGPQDVDTVTDLRTEQDGEGTEGEGDGEQDGQTEAEADGEGKDGEGEGENTQKPKAPQAPKNGDVVLTRLNEAPLIGQDADDYIRQTAIGGFEKVLKDLQKKVEKQAQQKPQDLLQQVEQKVTEMLEAQGPQTLTVKVNELPPVTIDGRQHSLLRQALPVVASYNHEGLRDNLMLVGPTGCGKTVLARQLAQALGMRFASVSATAGLSETAFTGSLFPTMDGAQFVTTEFLDFVENGGVFLVDEGDAMDANVSLVMNQVTANGHLPVPKRFNNPSATRHKDFILVMACNTWGDGASRIYVGRNQLDAAFLSRFTALSMDYDAELEKQLVEGLLPKDDAKALLKQWHSMRKKALNASLERAVGTRELVRIADQTRRGIWKTWADGISNFLENWSPSEKAKVA